MATTVIRSRSTSHPSVWVFRAPSTRGQFWRTGKWVDREENNGAKVAKSDSRAEHRYETTLPPTSYRGGGARHGPPGAHAHLRDALQGDCQSDA